MIVAGKKKYDRRNRKRVDLEEKGGVSKKNDSLRERGGLVAVRLKFGWGGDREGWLAQKEHRDAH